MDLNILANAHRVPLNLLVTLGHEIDPAAFGRQPAHIQISRHIPQSEVLPHCDAVISHAGSGSVLGALSHGLPSVLIPIGADQPLNADRCVRLGVGRALDALTASPDAIRTAVTAVLEDASYRKNAEALQDEFAALPDAAHAVRLLERLVTDPKPVLAD